VAKHLVENFLVSTRFIINFSPLYIEEYKVYRRIIATSPYTVHHSSGDLFNKLKDCIHRKDLFLKRDLQDRHEYVDIQAILAQGFVVVPDELNTELGNFSNYFSFQDKYFTF
jgi:hypothetical protein